MGRSVQKQRLDIPWLHSEAFLRCCLKSRESPLAPHIFAWFHGKEKALIKFLSLVWDKDHTKCKSPVYWHKHLTYRRVCPCFTAQGDWQNTHKAHCYCSCHEFKPETGEKGAPASTSAALGHRQAERGWGSTGPRPSPQLPSQVGMNNNRSWSYRSNWKYKLSLRLMGSRNRIGQRLKSGERKPTLTRHSWDLISECCLLPE